MEAHVIIILLAGLFFYGIGLVFAVRMGRRQGRIGLAVVLILILGPVMGLIVLVLIGRSEPVSRKRSVPKPEPEPRRPVMLSCPGCGAPVEQGARRCPYCDGKLEWE